MDENSNKLTKCVRLSNIDIWTKIVNMKNMSEAKKSKILTAARSVFLRFGFKRVSMNDIAEAAGMSRAALYLVFKNKEDVFIGVFRQWADETVAEIEREMTKGATAQEKISLAMELWVVRPFEFTLQSAEARELLECSFDFAEAALRQSYAKFEAALVPVLAALGGPLAARAGVDPAKTAHVLASAVRGFKQTATTPDELRLLIRDLLDLCLSSAPGNAKGPRAS